MSKQTLKGFFKLLIRNFWVKNIFYAFCAFVLLGIIVLNCLDLYTHHNRFIEVPDVQEMSAEEAMSELNRVGLRAEVIDSVYFRDKKPGTIVEQLPREGSKVKPNRIIFLTCNAITKRMLSFPDLQETSLRQAQSTLTGMGFKVGRVIETNSLYKGLVIEFLYGGRTVNPGTKIPDGAFIDIVVGNGLGENVTDSLSTEGVEEEESSTL